jgi:hypothetical protein
MHLTMKGDGACVTYAGYLGDGSILQRFQYHGIYSWNGWLKDYKLRREADRSPLFSAEVKNGGAILPCARTSSWRGT